MKIKSFILFLLVFCFTGKGFSQQKQLICLDFYGDTINLPVDSSLYIPYSDSLSKESVEDFYNKINVSDYKGIIEALLQYKSVHQADDWLFYQLIRKTAQYISPKGENYYRYTLYKWFLLTKSGFNATLSISANQLLFYVQCDENIYEIPSHVKNGKQYVCLNYHDYGSIDFNKHRFIEVPLTVPEARHAFSYKITRLPNFKPGDYLEKDLEFTYNDNEYRFKLKLNPQVKSIFANYPVVDYESYFNAPLSRETYKSLIPNMKKNLKGLNSKNGVDYLMNFTRYAFLFKADSETFGQEKRLLPEQTLLYENSDCEDRAALFYYLVKEIYNLPMLVLVYPKHVTIAVQFPKPVGATIEYKGSRYSVCEPTPQKENLKIGQILPELQKQPYEIAFAYNPGRP